MENAKPRIEFIDLAKGICILLVVLLHVFGDLSGTVIKIMNLFRMPLYFVLSGLFFKTYDSLGPFLKKKTNKLLIPFSFTFFCVIVPTTFLLNWKSGVNTTIENLLIGEMGKLNLGIDGAVWFLLCLFFVNVYFYLIFLVTRQRVVYIGVLSCVCGFVGYSLHQEGLYLPMWLDTSLTALPFFFMGYAMRKHSSVLQGSFVKKDYWGFAISLFILVAVYWFDESEGKSTISFGDNTFDISVASLYLGGISGTYAVLMFAKRFKRLPVVSYIGRYSIVVLITHLIYMFIIRNMLYQFHIPQDSILVNIGVFIIIVLLSLPTIKYGIKYLPYCFAQKDLWK